MSDTPYVAPDGVRYNAPMTFDNRGDAEAWLADQRSEIARGVWLSPTVKAERKGASSRTLGDYAEAWLKDRTNSKDDHLRPRTRDEYKRLLRAPDPDDADDAGGPLAELAALPLAKITPAKVRSWRSAQLATGKKTQTSRAYGLLNAIMTTAVADKLVDENPCTVKGGQSTHTGRTVTPPTDAELSAILEAIAPRFRALVIVAAIGGLRYCEATALRAKDVTVERGEDGAVIAVRLDVGRGVVRTEAGIVPGETKSDAGVRRVGIFGEDAAIVAEHVRGLIGDALLFPARDGASFLAQSAFWRHWDAARTAAGRADMPFHALRHYAGTRYAQAGATPRETMARLGHSSMGAAMRYQHSGNRDDELAARMARRQS
ncbi:tyrosine-type recombinase/integrase [Microbacterium lacticum]|uniref:Site-specific recombinase XerD n=1 Tax=Microbacterium lacticum TaxID=33885 RepID=A0A4Y3USF2_9MICO|nr:tyrosine-type recombinase/integrase [Microbacterium lacticum]TQN00505.1 site-specific recombinase XerD [Microbacterium lacticum]GEB96439.1 integrase [Microbacterium lacticum]